MSRVQLALNVSDLNGAVEFYSKFFKTPPTKLRPGYANFAILEPPLKLVLIENGGAPGSINHLGVEVFSSDEVVQAAKYLSECGLDTRTEEATTCCFAVQDKVWVDGVDGSPWEVYTVLDDAPAPTSIGGDEGCCTPDGAASAISAPVTTACC